MKTKVRVTAKDGVVILPAPGNPLYGAIRVEQTANEINEQGFLARKTRSSLIKGKITDLESMDLVEGQELPGNIVIVESTVKSFDKAQPKTAGEDGEVLTFGGKPIYRETYLDLTGKKEDVLLQHENAISAAAKNKAAQTAGELSA